VKSQAIVAALVVALSAPSAAVSQTPSERDSAAVVSEIERTLVEVIARVEPSVVAISRTTPRLPSIEHRPGDVLGDLRHGAAAHSSATIAGAGVMIDRAGLVLTQYLAVREGDEHTVTTIDGSRYAASIRAADPRSGLAVLTIAKPLQRPGNAPSAASGSFPALPIPETPILRKGQFVIAVGNPYAIETDGQPTASWGTITNLARKAPPGANLNAAPGPYGDYRTTLHHLGTLIQTDAKLGWSAGGGALVNLRGELVGITTTVATIAGHEQPAAYAIPTGGVFRRIIETLKEGREVEYGMLGIGFAQPQIESLPDRAPALSIAQVYPGSPAARAGLQSGDVLTHIADQPVPDIDTVQLLVSSLPPSSTMPVRYERRGRAGKTTVTLAKLAVAGKTIAAVRPDAWLGIRVDYATALEAASLAQAISSGAYDAQGCVLVSGVEPESVAWRAGVRPGMFISHVGGKRVATPGEFLAAARNIGNRLDVRLTQPLTPTSESSEASVKNPP
jgi:S1-C subfamily serine protease